MGACFQSSPASRPKTTKLPNQTYYSQNENINKNISNPRVSPPNKSNNQQIVVIFVPNQSSVNYRMKKLQEALQKLQDKDLNQLFHAVLLGVLELVKFFKQIDGVAQIAVKLLIYQKAFVDNLKQQRQKGIAGVKLLMNNQRQLAQLKNQDFQGLLQAIDELMAKKRQGDATCILLVFQQYTKLWLIGKISEKLLNQDSDHYLLLKSISTQAELLFRRFGLKMPQIQ